MILRLRIASLLRVIRSSPPRLAKSCASSPRTLPSRVSAFSCFKRYLFSCSAKTGFPCVDCHLCTSRNIAPFDYFFCKCPTKKGRCLTIRIHAIYFTAIKDMAANLERKWRNQFVFMQDQVIPADDDVQGGSYRYWFRVRPSNLLLSRHETKETQAP